MTAQRLVDYRFKKAVLTHYDLNLRCAFLGTYSAEKVVTGPAGPRPNRTYSFRRAEAGSGTTEHVIILREFS